MTDTVTAPPVTVPDLEVAGQVIGPELAEHGAWLVLYSRRDTEGVERTSSVGVFPTWHAGLSWAVLNLAANAPHAVVPLTDMGHRPQKGVAIYYGSKPDPNSRNTAVTSYGPWPSHSEMSDYILGNTASLPDMHKLLVTPYQDRSQT